MSNQKISDLLEEAGKPIAKLKPVMQNLTWDLFASGVEEGNQISQTKRLFELLPEELRQEFFAQLRPLVQFGMSSGGYLSQHRPRSTRIGYDYSKNAFRIATQKGFTVRLQDLDRHHDGKLEYQAQLTTDLQQPCDIIAIRSLEYLDPKAALLLVFFLINNAKPGSVFYIETYRDEGEASEKKSYFSVPYPDGFFASCFGPRTDIAFKHHKIGPESEICPTETGTYEQLVVSKIVPNH